MVAFIPGLREQQLTHYYPEIYAKLDHSKGEKMTKDKIEMKDSDEEKEIILYSPKRLSLISDLAGILSWIILVGFLGNIIVQIISLRTQVTAQGLILTNLLKDASFISYIFLNLIVPVLTGIGLFIVLQAASVGLNVLFEMDFNAREAMNRENI